MEGLDAMRVRERDEDEQEGVGGPKKVRPIKKTSRSQESAQRWVEMKKLPMPRLLHPVSGAKLLPDERIEYGRDRFILVEGDASAHEASLLVPLGTLFLIANVVILVTSRHS